VAIVDVNRLGQSQETMLGHNVQGYANRLKAFGWEVLVIDGHDIPAIQSAFEKAVHNESGKPFAIVAQTEKGRGISFLSNKDNWHGKPLPKAELEKALLELGPLEDKKVFTIRKPKYISLDSKQDIFKMTIPYKVGDSVATREVYGLALAQMGASNDAIVALDAEVKNSTYAIDFMKAFPQRFVECFIAEQNMVSVAAGFSRFGKSPFVSTFAAFLTRSFDQIRMAWLSKSNITFVGSHAGVSIGEDGSSQMGLEEIGMFGILPDATVVQPCDAVSAMKLLPLLEKIRGIKYMQTLRPKTTVIYNASEKFTIGGSKILRQSKKDSVVIVATGITVHEAIKASDVLKKAGIATSVVDCYSIPPVDKKTLISLGKLSKQKTLVVVEDHFIHGGLGDFVLEAVTGEKLRVIKMAVMHRSHSGKGPELMHKSGIDADCIVKKVKKLL
ncbi:MAG: transketolase, partial [Patescibacteria group bacterium]|nr:transketolase [Patescibacteria group bacterium]